MFTKARIKLTAWYLLFIMTLSITFSLAIYRVLQIEIMRFEQAQRFRIERRMQFFNTHIPQNTELIEEIKDRLKFHLLMLNLSILVISGGLGYLLAGRTLTPIAEMVDEQNRFISDASHQLRTPLTSLKSAMEVNLRDKKLNIKDVKELISGNLKDVNKLEMLTDRLLEMSRHQNTNRNFSFQDIKVSEIIKDAIAKIAPVARKNKIELNNLTTDITVEGLKHELIDLFVILLDNAVKYSKTNSTVAIVSEKKDMTVVIRVKDSGFGIPKKDLPFIFDRFYRSQSIGDSSKVSGYGLGLSIAKKIVKLHNGSINVKSAPNTGSEFIVILPMSQTKLT